jgi:methionine synthase / methylenetetrahydrofolate reductase(NADPH)
VIEQAIRAVRDVSDLPIVAQMTIQMDGNTLFGATPEVFTSRSSTNSGRRRDRAKLRHRSESHVLTPLEKMRVVTSKKLSAQPNAGLPRDVQGRQFYMGSPEYMATFAERFVQAGRNLSAAAAARRRRISN